MKSHTRKPHRGICKYRHVITGEYKGWRSECGIFWHYDTAIPIPNMRVCLETIIAEREGGGIIFDHPLGCGRRIIWVNPEFKDHQEWIEKRKVYSETIHCDSCRYLGVYMTGSDEHPPFTSMPYCRKDHWVGEGPEEKHRIGAWDACTDYETKVLTGDTL